MKKTSTQTIGRETSNTKGLSYPEPAPRMATIAFLRQFARAYRPAPAANMPGIVLN